jgi:DNA-binding GntR family transcriptional regulator
MTGGRVIRQEAAPLRQQVVGILRQEILDDVLHPGDRLLENTLCERYGVSRTVIREALRQLESEKLITMLPNRGPIVTVLTVADIQALYEVRRALEGLAGELFAERATDEQAAGLIAHLAAMESTYLHGTVETRGVAKDTFYALLLEGAQNEVLEASLTGIHTRIGIFRHYAYVDEERVAHSMEELRVIVHAAAKVRDPALARAACEEHIRGAGKLALVEYRKNLEALNAQLAAGS